MKPHNLRKRGSALISALFIMTLVAIAATAMSTRLQLDIYRTRLSITSDKLYLASQYVTFWAISELKNNKTPLVTNADNDWVLAFPSALQNTLPDIRIKGALYDMQGRFNLNNLSDANYSRIFSNLLEKVLPAMNQKDREAIAFATQLWISPYKPGRGTDELVSWYMKQNPPYYQGSQFMQSVSEFRLIRGVTASVYNSLEPYLTALPEVTPINVNTAPKMLLMALGNGLTEDQVNELINARSIDPLNKTNEISKVLEKLAIRKDTTSLKSKYFMSKAQVEHDDMILNNFNVFKRDDKEDMVLVSLLSESINSY